MRVYIDCAVCTPRHLCCCVMSRYMCVCESQAFKTKKWTNDSGKRERVYVCACAKRAQYSAVCCVLCAWHRQQSQRDESYSLAFHSYRLYLRRYWFINMVFRSLVQSFIAYLDTHWWSPSRFSPVLAPRTISYRWFFFFIFVIDIKYCDFNW